MLMILPLRFRVSPSSACQVMSLGCPCAEVARTNATVESLMRSMRLPFLEGPRELIAEGLDEIGQGGAFGGGNINFDRHARAQFLAAKAGQLIGRHIDLDRVEITGHL